jgi:hypothetical protein
MEQRRLSVTLVSGLRQQEVLIEHYRKGKVDEAFQAFKKIYLEVVEQLTDHLKSQEPSN